MIQTERLILSPIDLKDAPFLLELINTPKWKKYIGDRKVHTITDAEEYITKRCLPQYERLAYGNYVVSRKSDSQKLGTVGLYDRAEMEGVDIGFAFLPDYEGKGYAYEAAIKLLQTGFEEFGLTKIKAITLPTNLASIKLIEKLGLRFKKFIRIKGDKEELSLYVIEY